MNTIEINHSNFLTKLEYIDKIIKKIKSIEITTSNEITKKKVIELKKNLNDDHSFISYNYTTGVINILTKYYDKKHTIREKYILSKQYIDFISEEVFLSKINECILYIRSLLEVIQCEDVKLYINTQLNKLLSSKINIRLDINKYDICEYCKIKMDIFSQSSDMKCIKCGNVKILYGSVFQDDQFYNQEGKRSKHGKYDPSRHCRFWVQRIQANNITEIPKVAIDSIIRCIERDNRIGKFITCNKIRTYLKETKKTEFNNHIPLIRKIITGYVPPQLSEKELRELYNLFDKCVNVYEKVKPAYKSNTIYYPFIIYKILDNIIKNGIRKRRILECIHLQSRDTLIHNDKLWKQVCSNVHNIIYTPTDRLSMVLDL